jgi:hypothetical protein
MQKAAVLPPFSFLQNNTLLLHTSVPFGADIVIYKKKE